MHTAKRVVVVVTAVILFPIALLGLLLVEVTRMWDRWLR